MKQKQSKNIKLDEGITDPELQKNLNHLVKLGLVERFELDGKIIYGLTPLGDTYGENLLKKDKNKSRKLS